MKRNVHIVEDLSNETVNKIKEDSNCGVIVCTTDAESEEEQTNLLELSSKDMNIYVGIDQSTLLTILEKLEDELEDRITSVNKKEDLADLEERMKGNEWLGHFDDEFNWFGDSEIGFRYCRIDVDLFRRLGLKPVGNLGVYIEVARCHLPESIKKELFDIFTNTIYKERGWVHLEEWRYKILDVDHINSGCSTVKTSIGTMYNYGLLGTGPDESYLFTFTLPLNGL